MGVTYAFVAEFTREHTVKTLAYWKRDRIVNNVEFDVRGTPCEDVVAGRLCHYPTEVAKQFPLDTALAAMGIESYLGVPLLDPWIDPWIAPWTDPLIDALIEQRR